MDESLGGSRMVENEWWSYEVWFLICQIYKKLKK